MSRVTLLLLPDQREKEGVIEAVNERLQALKGLGRFVPLTWGPWPRAWGARADISDPHEALKLIGDIDWHHPVLVVYRTSEDVRWSHCTLGVSFGTLSAVGEDHGMT